MEYSDLLQSNVNDDMENRRQQLRKLNDKQLAMAASNPLSDYRNVQVARELLRSRGVKGVPQ